MTRPQRQKLVRRKVADPLSLTARDIALLRDLGEYRFLNTEQILALHQGGQRNLMRRLAAMFDLGFLDRPKTQGNARLRSSHTVYSLDRKGAEVLGKDAEEREGLLRRIRETKHTSPLMAHAIMISQFRVCLMLALKNRPDIKLTRWVQGNDLKSMLPKSSELVPDAFFVLETPTRTCPCFLEADRATMGVKKFLPKLQKYWRHFRVKGFQDSLGITNFRVLTGKIGHKAY
ncbi:MAG: replication-relaxation family protein [Patescibacteria group bacterium]|nr:replication-relaxation family protein [Patescibacteria group bacterium]